MGLLDDLLRYTETRLNSELISKFEKLMVERFIRDVHQADDKGWIFDENRASRVINFFSCCRHTKGDLGGQAIDLEPFQIFEFSQIYGWIEEETGLRRFQEFFKFVPKKNGKTLECAGLALYHLIADDEYGPEVFTAATKVKQAKICWQMANDMVRTSQDLQEYIDAKKLSITTKDGMGVFDVLSRESNTEDGFNPSFVVCDEVHAWKNRDLYDNAKSGQVGRSQPILGVITTAGFNTASFCYSQQTYAEQVLQGIIEDDYIFCSVYRADPELDDPWDENTWFKVNPLLGKGKKLKNMRVQAAKAKSDPGERGKFLTKQLNIWTNAKSAHIDMNDWSACSDDIDEESLIGLDCIIGGDLASKQDISAFVKIFDIDGNIIVVPRFYLPANAIYKKTKQELTLYEKWVEGGFLTVTEGRVVNQETIEKDIDLDRKKYKVKALCYDPWNATELMRRQENKRLKCIEVRQGTGSLSAPMKEIDNRLANRTFKHPNNPVLNWMASNLISTKDDNGNIKPSKEKSLNKIDGMSAIYNAVYYYLDLKMKGKPLSVYKSRGILFL
jgi:phage terminase large subunit-like protein